MSSSMKYCVGEFNLPYGVSVEALSISWTFTVIVEGKKVHQCYWPKDSVARVRKMIIKDAPIDRLSWDIFEFKLLGKYREYKIIALLLATWRPRE